MMTATPIVNSLSVISAYPFEGHFWLHVPCNDYDQFDTLPKAVRFQGRDYGRTGWNSDKGVAYYSTRQPFATFV